MVRHLDKAISLPAMYKEGEFVLSLAAARWTRAPKPTELVGGHRGGATPRDGARAVALDHEAQAPPQPGEARGGPRFLVDLLWRTAP